ncbi:SDR family NAD(P)-dependent oxidoreductase [Amycolatopsis echigonensis]|uniref:SDR family NAD(P)-dependent oxidoreductase n=1 Tax=Amycolatopsis echigonensis TaxID=2576905 RepID=A0A8E1W0M5_9PSEU|nr:SDR family NAD(P)-dependent oxidoreductase [Amycolatopsis echigonensis]MBB2501582.1 SDR family NAD(P)-dependent oxidoreductase [Amycolatopsis echigonensis]
MQHTIVMTGATRGIGRIASEHILRRSPDTHLVVVARESTGSQFSGNVSYVVADLNSLKSVRSAAAEICHRLDRGDLPPLRHFVGNAGVQYTDNLIEGPEGIESTFMVNVLANHVFVRAFEDRFGGRGRIVVTVSDTHFGDFTHNLGMVPRPAWDSPDVLARPRAFPKPETTAAGRAAYSTSKLAAIYLVHEYARRLPAGVDVIAYNPGFVPATGLARNAGPIGRFMMRRVLPLLAFTPFGTHRDDAGRYLAEVVLGGTQAPTGSYVDRDKAARSSDESYDPRREQELWDTAERLTALDPAT